MSSTHPNNPVTHGQSVEAIRDSILVTDMYFGTQVSNSGLIIIDDDSTERGIKPRWGKVYAIGPEYKRADISIGQWILIAHGRWTRGFDFVDYEGNSKTLRRVDPKDILLVYNGEGVPPNVLMGDKA